MVSVAAGIELLRRCWNWPRRSPDDLDFLGRIGFAHAFLGFIRLRQHRRRLRRSARDETGNVNIS
jgi:hypothetical protein